MSYRKKRIFEYEGITYRSNYEKRQAQRLTEAGIPFEYETKSLKFFETILNGECLECGAKNVVKHRSYTPDFYFPETGIFVETKGKFDPSSRTKMINVCSQSDEDIRMVFMRDNWLTKKHKMNYSRWCDIKGIQYAVGNIPLEWTTTKERK